MTVRQPADRVRRILDVVRPHVDEIVIAVDSEGDPATFEACEPVADRMLRFESPGFGASLITWILRQSSADWILRLDDDEIPSAALLGSLRSLTEDDEVTHVGLERRWLYPDASRFIDCFPWLPDYQLRLVRNVPGTWRAGGIVHAPLEVAGAGRLVPLALYHADLLLLDAAERRAKADRYERARPGLRLEDFPTNAMYLPDDCDDLPTAPVPVDDSQLVEALCAPASRTGAETRSLPPAVPREAIVRHDASPLPADAHKGMLTVPRERGTLPAGLACQVEVEVANRSSIAWPSSQAAASPVRIGHRWRRVGTNEVAVEGPRTLLSAPVAPGCSERLMVHVDVPATAGAWLLELGLLEEGVRWFGTNAAVVVEVRAPRWTTHADGYHGSFGLDGLDLRLLDHLGGRRGGFFVEAGANDGVSQSNTLLLELALGWRGLLVEPVPRLAAAARVNRPRALVEQAALVPFGAERTVQMWDVGLMSLVAGAMGGPDRDLAHVRDGAERQGGLEVEQLEVPAVPLSTILDRHGVGAPDLLVLDVEGFEAAALGGLDLGRHAPEHMLVETRDREELEDLLGDRYEATAELSHHDILYRRRPARHRASAGALARLLSRGSRTRASVRRPRR